MIKNKHHIILPRKSHRGVEWETQHSTAAAPRREEIREADSRDTGGRDSMKDRASQTHVGSDADFQSRTV